MYPFKFNPILKSTIWGGEKIIPFKHLNIEQPQVGESWEISNVPGDESVVANGTQAGKNLSQLVKEYKGSLVGESNYQRFGDNFPLLIKFIDACDDLSIQVHPDDELAKKRHNSMGKTEMWYVVSADKDAHLRSGFSKQVTPAEYEASVGDNTITDILADQIWAQCRDLPDAERYRAYIKGELAKADALADMTDVERATTMVFGQSGYYIWSINSIDSVSIAGSLSVPMLFLQGSTDIQVLADVDYVRWIGALSDDPAAEFALYDGLNHLFMESDGPYMGTALEYSKRGHVDQAVIDDMAEFIMGS